MIGGGGMARGKAPRTISCYICGRGYGLSSIEVRLFQQLQRPQATLAWWAQQVQNVFLFLQIHVPQCKKKFIAQQKLLAPHERKALPKAPPGWGGAPAEAAPEQPIPAASRPSTGGGGGGGGSDWSAMTDEQIAAMNAASNHAFETQAMSKCENCGRTFLQDRLPVHQRSCRPGKPAASVQKFIQRGQAGGGGAHGVVASPITRRPNTTHGSRSSPREPSSLSSTSAVQYPAAQDIQAALQDAAPAQHARAAAPAAQDVPGRLVELEGVVADMARNLQQLTKDMGKALQQMAELRAQVAPGNSAAPAHSLPNI